MTDRKSFILLLLNQVLSHIDGARYQDDQTLDDVLVVCVDGEEVQRYEDDTQQEHAAHNSADFTGTTDKRYTADNAGRNRVALIVLAGRS